jgi:putative peptidoglycan lipid II flippase
VINIPAAVGLVVLAEPVIRLLFQRGAFRADDTALMVPVLAVYALGLPLFSFVTLVLRAFHAERDTRTPVHAAILSFVVNVGLSLALMGPLSTIGLAVAGNAAIAVQAWFLQSRLTAKRGIMSFGHLGPTLIRILIAAVVMGAVVAGSWRGLLALCGSGVLTDLLALGVLIPLGIAVYGGLLWAMKIEGREDLAAMIERIRLRLWPAR